MERNKKTIIRCAFGAYIALMLWLLFGQRWGMNSGGAYLQQMKENLNLIPFRTIRQFMHILQSAQGGAMRHAVINLAGNVVMFVPLGFFLPLTSEKCRHYGKHLSCVLVILLAIELLQLITLLGSCDVDDFLLNVPGTAIGYGIFCLFFRKNRGNTHKL